MSYERSMKYHAVTFQDVPVFGRYLRHLILLFFTSELFNLDCFQAAFLPLLLYSQNMNFLVSESFIKLFPSSAK